MENEMIKSSFDFKAWIQEQTSEDYSIILEDDFQISLVTEYAKASISFTEIEDNTIIEFQIITNKDNTVKFYLHFELKDEEHAKQLFEEMIDTLRNLKNEKTLKVLLSCSSGLTTSMFAENLKSVAEMLGLDYEFNAVAYLNIYEEVENYDVILIAPQIGYAVNRLKDSLPHKLILQVPTSIFATYDALAAIKFIQGELEVYNNMNKEVQENECTECVEFENRILSIVISISKEQTRIFYRLNDKCEIVDSNKIIKPTMKIRDLYDIIDTVILKNGPVDVIGIASPGIVKDNKQLIMPTDGSTVDITKEFEEKYGIKVFVYNNANAGAVGFSLEHPDYKNIVFHSQPFGFGVGGQGIIIDGKVNRGLNGISGEIRYFLRRMQLSDDPDKLAWTERGAIELLTKSLLPTISIVGPEAIAIYSPMTPDICEIKHVLLSFIDESFLPELYYIKEPSSYMLSGITKLCVQFLEE